LQKLLPALFTRTAIEFRKTRQTIAKTKKVAEGLQHGFFIYFRPKPTREKTAEEIKSLKAIMRESTSTDSTADKKTESTDSLGYTNWCGVVWVVVDTTT